MPTFLKKCIVPVSRAMLELMVNRVHEDPLETLVNVECKEEMDLEVPWDLPVQKWYEI